MTSPGNQFDVTRAELFEALGHPIRVKILQALETKPMGFADLKKVVGIESSGHLEFHLRKLSGLVGSTAEGSYALTDDGKEAIRVLGSTEAIRGKLGPSTRASTLERVSWTRVLLAILLIGTIVLAVVAVYQENQIATLNGNGSSGTVSVNGLSYYYETLPYLPNGTHATFHGVTFTSLTTPDENILRNNTFVGSLRLSNGTLLDLNGKTVSLGVSGGTILVSDMLNHTVNPLLMFPIGVSVTFPDGSRIVHSNFNVSAKYDRYDEVYDLDYTILPVINPWFIQHGGISVGLYVNYFPPTYPVSLYVSNSG